MLYYPTMSYYMAFRVAQLIYHVHAYTRSAGDGLQCASILRILNISNAIRDEGVLFFPDAYGGLVRRFGDSRTLIYPTHHYSIIYTDILYIGINVLYTYV